MKFHWASAKNPETFGLFRNCQKLLGFAHKIEKHQKLWIEALAISQECLAQCIYQVSLSYEQNWLNLRLFGEVKIFV